MKQETQGQQPVLTEEESQQVIGAIPLQALPDPRDGKWYAGDCARCQAIVVDCCEQCERCVDCCICFRRTNQP